MKERYALAKRNQPNRRGGQALWWVAGIAVIAAGVLISINLLGKNAAKASAGKTDAEVHAVRTVKGPATAKVKLVEFSDFL